MPRVIAIDFGLKRTGLAVTDPLADHCDSAGYRVNPRI